MKIQKHLKVISFIAIVLLSTSCEPTQEMKQESKQPTIDQLATYKTQLANNKALVADFIEAMRQSDVAKLKTMISDDFSWWIIGKPEYLATAGEHDTDYFLGFFKGAELFPEGADFKATNMIAEDNTVAAEAEFKAKTAMGSQYENYYHFLFVIENGKIKRMKEYMDTYHAKVTFGL